MMEEVLVGEVDTMNVTVRERPIKLWQLFVDEAIFKNKDYWNIKDS